MIWIQRCDLKDECQAVRDLDRAVHDLHDTVGIIEVEASILLEFFRRATGRMDATLTDVMACDLDEADRLRRDHEAMDRLPKTADGVAVMMGMELWGLDVDRYGNEYRVESDRIWHGAVTGLEVDEDSALVTLTLDEFGGYVECWLASCYSTSAAAEAAKGATDGTN